MTKEVTASTYSDDQKLLAVEAYFVTRSSTKASAQCGVPASTIRRWKNKDKVTWNSNMAKVREQYNDTLDGTLTDILELASQKILKSLKEGDVKMTPQGEMVSVPVPAAEVARIAKQAFEQRETLRADDPNAANKDKRPYSEDELGRAFEKAAMKGKDKGLVINNDVTEESINAHS